MSYRGGSGGGRYGGGRGGRYGGGRGSASGGGGRGGGSGRGEYYRNKYGGGGRGGSQEYGSSNGGNGSNGQSARSGTYDDLQRLLQQIDGKSYGAYHDLETSEQHGGWYNPTRGFTLLIGRAQSDPFAPPTSCRLVLPAATIHPPAALYSNPIRRMAAADYWWRRVHQTCRDLGADQTVRQESSSSSTSTGGWSGPKGGDVQISEPTQHVMEQSAVTVQADGTIHLQLSINLPARGRTILGRAAQHIFVNVLDRLVQAIIESVSHQVDQDCKTAILCHVDCIEDQLWLQQQLPAAGLVAFVANHAILPRWAGSDDRPMPSHKHPIPFGAPPSLEISFVLPNAQTTITGMGIPTGITLLCGGGFHGKSTLLQALQYGIYAKCPGDGREYCVTSPCAVKIRAEDGRYVQHVDISSFVNHLPLTTTGSEHATKQFSTTDASGSTSQASNIVEALELGADTLLLDEDTCATNFMIRDAKMVQLVAADKEPITPFVRVAPSLSRDYQVSVILVIGGAGDYFEIADRVLLMDCYQCVDATERARQIVAQGGGRIIEPAPFDSLRERCPDITKFIPNGKVKASAKGMISYGETELDVRALEQVVSIAQTRAIALALQTFSSIQVNGTPHPTLRTVLQELDKRIEQEGLNSVLSPGQFNGALTRPRLLEIGAAANRLRRDGAIVQK